MRNSKVNSNAQPGEESFREIRETLPAEFERLIRLYFPKCEWFWAQKQRKRRTRFRIAPEDYDFEYNANEFSVEKFSVKEFSNNVCLLSTKIKTQGILTFKFDYEMVSDHVVNLEISVLILGYYILEYDSFWYSSENIRVDDLVCSELKHYLN